MRNAAEAWPQREDPKDDIEELPQDLLKKEPPAIPESESQKALREAKETRERPTSDTEEALKTLKELAETRDAHLAAEERKKIMETRHKVSSERMRREMGARMLHELPPEDVKLEGEESDEKWAAEAARNLGPRKKAEPPPIPAAAKKPEVKKPWYKRLFGSKG